MQIIHISGFLSRDPELASTRAGDEVCRLNVPVKQGWGDNEKTNWFRVSVWGKRARSLADNLRKGVKVNVVGELTIGEYDGKPQYDIRAIDVDFPPAPKQGDGGREERPRSYQRGDQGHIPGFDDASEVPF